MSPRRMRETMAQLVTGVCVVTVTVDGTDVAMTANSVTSVSLEPPLVLVCIARSARFHDAIVRSSSWGISILGAHAAEVSDRLATSAPTPGQLAGLDLRRGPATGVALLQDSCAALECRTYAEYPGGDHTIVVGQVLHVERSQPPRAPLVYHRGRYEQLPS